MRDLLKKLYRETWLGNALLRPFIYFRNRILPKEIQTSLAFKRILKYPLNLDNPTTFNDKLQWLKFNVRTDLHTQCADKFEVRKYVAEKLGEQYLIPLYFQSYRAEDLIPENFPEEPFIIKTNHDSSGGVFVRSKKDINWPQLQRQFRKRLRSNYYHENGEWQYKNIRPCIIAEQLLKDTDGGIPADFKLFCFNGKVRYIQLDLDRETDHKRNMYDTDWKLQEFLYVYKNGRAYPKPDALNKMISLAEKIAVDFDFVRVDFYNIGDRIYFGEITFHPESGYGAFIPAEWDLKFGQMLRIPTDNPESAGTPTEETST